ncbi:hypothetical protein [Pseudomonas sp. NFACC10-1]|uniref:hypothetical protein n=1 Tax=Pseudomonas sp. NFACC10-1 TaxID=1566247 RepID=UPI0009088F32|nr:hypothetical protein [Pseudomonas sp. NFACC10-1]SFW65965.1 hypothetical protein SAMN03159505_02587 [Pseudomonas sp. NFACC10-1]
MSNECKVLSIEPTQEMLDAITTERKKGNGALQCWYAAFAAAPQPPALDGVPAGLDLQRIVTEALMGMIAAVTSTSPPASEPPPPFIQAGIDRAVSRISAHLAPLQAETERLKDNVREVTTYRDNAIKKIERLRNELTGTEKERDQFKERCDELECDHEWTDDGEFNLHCTNCGKQENHEPYGWVQTRGNAINHFTQEWDVVEEWEAQGFEYKPMFDAAQSTPVEDGPVEYGPTPGCKQCQEAENCGLTDCPECDAQLCEDVNGDGVRPGSKES